MSTSEEEDAESASLYFVCFSLLLATVLILCKLLHENHKLHSILSEAALTLIVGMIAGGAVNLFIPSAQGEEEVAIDDDENYSEENDENVVVQKILSFSPNLFFMALLPPILFYSGYQLRRELFYRHITPIVLFAAVGTTICALVTASTLFGIEQLGWFGAFQPTLLELLTFGSLIAATDTVSVISVLQAKRVDPHLFYVVFGESALNDAVALVLFTTFCDFLNEKNLGAGTIARGVAAFFLDFIMEAVGSPLLGIVFGFCTALIFKRFDLREQKMIELGLHLLSMYVPYMIAECLHLSGIVAIFFSGMSARRYVAPNLSEETKNNGEVLFKVAAYLAEIIIFLELGLSIFGFSGSFNWSFVACALFACLLGRAVSIYPIAYLYNLSLRVRPRDGTMSQAEESIDIEVEPARSDDGIRMANSDISIQGIPSFDSQQSQPRVWRTTVKRRTPPQRKDKKISKGMAHVLWFAGLRGAVAYACVRRFPDNHGHDDEFIAATMVCLC